MRYVFVPWYLHLDNTYLSYFSDVNILRSLTGAAVLVGFDVFKDIYIKLRQFPED